MTARVDHLAARFAALGWGGKKPTAVLLTSADEEATAGLVAVVERFGCKVVAPEDGLERVRKLCPAGTTILTDGDAEAAGWFDARAIPLGGRGLAPVAYRLSWAGGVQAGHQGSPRARPPVIAFARPPGRSSDRRLAANESCQTREKTHACA